MFKTTWEHNRFYDPDAEISHICSLMLHHETLPQAVPIAGIYIADGAELYSIKFGIGTYLETAPTLRSAKDHAEAVWPFRGPPRHPRVAALIGPWKGREKWV